MVFCDIAWKRQIQSSLKFNPYQTQLSKIDSSNYEKYLDLLNKENFFSTETLPLENIDFLFFTNLNSTDEILINNKLYNRLVDPLYEAALEIGSAKKIQIVKAISPALDNYKKFANKPLMIIPDFIYKNNSNLFMKLPETLLTKLKTHIPFIDIDKNTIEKFFDWQIHMVNYYSRILDKLKPKIVFFHPYYYYTPLILAANELGIRTVDIQHGIMHGYNEVFYDNWQEYDDRYQAIPNNFLVWSENEANYLNETVFIKEKSIISGYPWLDYQKELVDKDSLKDFLSSKIKNYKMCILVTLQRDSIIPSWLLNMINETEKDVCWILRKHPKGTNIHTSLKSKPNVLLGDQIDNFPLFVLFETADFNFTPGSTTVLEADYFGCKSYIYDEEGYVNYKKYIDENLVGVIQLGLNSIYDLKLSVNLQRKIDYYPKIDLKTLLAGMIR